MIGTLNLIQYFVMCFVAIDTKIILLYSTFHA